MKKALVVALAILMTVCFVACTPTAAFISNGQLNRLVRTYGETIQAEITIEYNNDESDVKLVIVYDLHLAKAPITVINFVDLVLDGHYTDSLLHSRYATSDGLRGGVYKIHEIQEGENYKESDVVYDRLSTDYTIKGEFPSNFWETNDLVHELGSIAMYHDNPTTNTSFDKASAEIYITLNSNSTSNNENFAVFATIAEGGISVYCDDEAVVEDASEFPSWVLDELYRNNTTTMSATVETEGQQSTTTANVLKRQIFITSVTLLGTANYADLAALADNYRTPVEIED